MKKYTFVMMVLLLNWLPSSFSEEPNALTAARKQYVGELRDVRARYENRLNELDRLFTQKGDSTSVMLIRTEKEKLNKAIRTESSDPGVKSIGHPIIGKWGYEFHGKQVVVEFNQRFFTRYSNGKPERSVMYDVIDQTTVKVPFEDQMATYRVVDKDTIEINGRTKAVRIKE